MSPRSTSPGSARRRAPSPRRGARTAGAGGFLPAAPPRAHLESVLARLIATAGVIGIGTAIGAVMGAHNVSGWVIGLVASGVTVILAAILWRSRRL